VRAHKKSMTDASQNFYQAKLRAPFGVLGIRTIDDKCLINISFLSAQESILTPKKNSAAHLVCVQLQQYFDNPKYQFDLPIKLSGTAHQIKVWEALQKIPSGRPWSYGELSQQIDSSPRAVGTACGHNPIVIVIPCHRIIAANGQLGGFMGGKLDDPLSIKKWLLRHETHETGLFA
jgi:methylated-DNA-[protein]-cysteine S-methyltransferase